MPKAKDIQQAFEQDVAEHQMEVLQDQGVHRCLKFSRPGDSNKHFLIITWPGSLCFTGDMGTFVFQWWYDMFHFFNGPPHFNYWAEKLQASQIRDGHEFFSAEVFEERIQQDFNQFVEDERLGEEEKAKAWEQIEAEVLNAATDGEIEAKAAAVNFFLDRDGASYPFQDFWEHDCKEYTYWFLWCCHAIPWAIEKFQLSKF